MAMVRTICGTQYLWTCQHIGVNRYGTNGTGTLSADRTAIEWFKIQTTPTVGIAETDRIFDNGGANPKHYYYPSLAVNKHGDLVIGFSGSSGNNLMGAFFWGKLKNGNSSAGPVQYFPARTSSNSVVGIQAGDYSSTTLDPINGLAIWTIQEYSETNSTAYTWGTVFAPISPY